MNPIVPVIVEPLNSTETNTQLNKAHKVYIDELAQLGPGGAERNYAFALIEIWVSDETSNFQQALDTCFLKKLKEGSKFVYLPNTYYCEDGQLTKAMSYFYNWINSKSLEIDYVTDYVRDFLHKNTIKIVSVNDLLSAVID